MTKRRRDPTMKRRSKEDSEKLNQQFMSLQQDYATFKRSSNPHGFSRRSADSNTITIKTLPLLENSPRSLMSSLQLRRSPSEGWWRVRSSDKEREEILRERKAAIESGKLKGRRLFGRLEVENEMGFGAREEICSVSSSYGSHDGGDEYGGSKEEVVLDGSAYCCCCCLGGSCLDDEKVEIEEVIEKKVEREEEEVVEGEKIGVDVKLKKKESGGGGRWMLLMGWFTVALMVIITLGIISMGFNRGGRYGNEEEVILVPT